MSASVVGLLCGSCSSASVVDGVRANRRRPFGGSDECGFACGLTLERLFSYDYSVNLVRLCRSSFERFDESGYIDSWDGVMRERRAVLWYESGVFFYFYFSKLVERPKGRM